MSYSHGEGRLPDESVRFEPPLDHTVLVAMPRSGEVYITANSEGTEFFLHGPEGAELDRPLSESDVEDAIFKHGYEPHDLEFESPEAMHDYRQEIAGELVRERGSDVLNLDYFDQEDVLRLLKRLIDPARQRPVENIKIALNALLSAKVTQETPDLKSVIEVELQKLDRAEA